MHKNPPYSWHYSMFEQTFHVHQQCLAISQKWPQNLLDTVSRKIIKTKIANRGANWAVPLAGGQHQGQPPTGSLQSPVWTRELGEQSRSCAAAAPERAAAPAGDPDRAEMNGALPRCQGCADRPGEASALCCVHSSSGSVRGCKPHLCSLLRAEFHTQWVCSSQINMRQGTSQSLLPGWFTEQPRCNKNLQDALPCVWSGAGSCLGCQTATELLRLSVDDFTGRKQSLAHHVENNSQLPPRHRHGERAEPRW